MITRYTRPLYLLPFDHRTSYIRGLFGWKEPLNVEQMVTVANSKHVIYAGFQRAIADQVPKDHIGLLVDEEFGSAILRDAASKGYMMVASVEKSGQQEFEFAYGEDFAQHIEAFHPTFAKVLVRYNPEGDAALNQRQVSRLTRLSDYLHRTQRLFMFELLVPFLHELEETRQQLLYLVPNIPDPSAPIGKDENDNVPIRYWGGKPTFDFQPLDHSALMQKLDVVDIQRAVKIAGARSYALKDDAARLELALMNFAMDRIARKGFTPLTVPAMAREFSFIGSGQFPRGRDQVYAIEDEDTFLVGTAEVSLTGIYKDEMLRYEELPLTLVGYCPCFRKEAGTYGKDTRGVFRIHQFNQVEQYVISKVDHEDSLHWHEQLITNAGELVQVLELPYRAVNVCTGDMGDGKVGMYDLECWIPSEGRYRETHSCSYFHHW